MHVAHFHPPRAVVVTLIAAALAIVITLVIVSGAGDMSVGPAASTGRSAPIARLVPKPPLEAHSTETTLGSRPAWLTSPFVPLGGSRITPGPTGESPSAW